MNRVQNISNIKIQMLSACQRLDLRQLVANHDGNISFRISENEFLVTPTAFAKSEIKESDLLVINREGQILHGAHKVFSEWVWHRAIYEEYSEVSCIVHAHPPHAMALSIAGDIIETPSIPEAIVSLGCPIQTISWVSTSKPELSDLRSLVREGLSTSYVFNVPGNGAFAVGDNPEMAYLRMELLEHVSKIHYLATKLGPVKRLPSSFVNELLTKRPVLKPNWKADVGELKEETKSGPSFDAALIEKIKSLVIEQLK